MPPLTAPGCTSCHDFDFHFELPLRKKPDQLLNSASKTTPLKLAGDIFGAMATTGPDKAPSPFVTLVSSDGFEFNIRRSAACVSTTIRRMLDLQSILGHLSNPFTSVANNVSQATSVKPRRASATSSTSAASFWKKSSPISTTTRSTAIVLAFLIWTSRLSYAWNSSLLPIFSSLEISKNLGNSYIDHDFHGRFSTQIRNTSI